MKKSRIYDLSGSPGFASPGFDINPNGKRERAAQFGLTDENEESFECNQSFPKIFNNNKQKHNNFSPDLNRIKGCDLNSVSFLKKNLIKNLNTSLNRKGAHNLFNDTLATSNYMNNSCLSTTVDKSWILYNQFLNSNALFVNNYNNTLNYDQILAVNNPNKALIVINGRTTEILTANNISCDLFGYTEEKLIGMKLKDLLDLNEKSTDEQKPEILMESDKLDQNGRIVLCSGKVFDAFTNKNNEENDTLDVKTPNNLAKITISMFMQKLTDEQEPKCLCVMEPIQKITGTFAINVKGRIKYYNPNFSYMFGYTNIHQLNSDGPSSLSLMSASSILNGKDITELIPSMKIPMSGILQEHKKQLLTGRSFQGENIPLIVNILNKQLFNNEEIIYNCNVNVYTNISGLITVRPTDYKINSYNSTFARFLFGYDDKELIDKPITYLIPNFFDPDQNSTAANRMTPLAVNNSYLNSGNCSSKRGSLAIGNKTNLNNGSFLEATKNTPQKQQGNKSIIKNTNVPAVVITEAENKLDNSNSTLEDLEQDNLETKDFEENKTCLMCNIKFRPSKKAQKDLCVEFNLESDEYSPNKKCANYLENINFSPTSSNQKTSSSVTNTPQSSVKKTLLAKAITNNANINTNDKSNLSIDDVSLLSACSSTSSYMDELSSPTRSPCKDINQDQSFSNMDLSELDSLNEQGDLKQYHNLCDQCKLIQKLDMVKKQNEGADNSLITLDNEDMIDDDNQSKQNKNKRKASFTRIGSDQNLDNLLENRRRSSILSDLNSNNNCTQSNANILSQNLIDKNKKFKNQVTSTPAAVSNPNLNSNTASKLKSLEQKFNNKICMPSPSKFRNTNDGIYFGRGKHIDGSLIRIFFQRKLVKLDKEENDNDEPDQYLICIWISRDPYSDKSIIECSFDQSFLHRTNLNQTSGDINNYLNEYEDLRTLGRGASGFVQLARRKIDKFEVVTKYILKSKIYKENWINDEKYGNIPLEISILCKLDHRNLIKVLEVFQDNDHVQMIMEKHGCGMDLFEFIDRQRRHIDEGLASYIFKQIVSAVSYLHSNMIVHRDIKDENIVINETFHIKLIDFGSAAYVTKGKKFATFCGTMDYCSPDVLLGNKYYGPELDVWTCGIALYTLVFCENPFQSAEETIECILKPPFKVSKELMKLLFSILCPKPELRATIEEIETNEWVNQPVDITKFKWEDVIRDTEFHSNDAGDFHRDEELNPNMIIKPCNQMVERQIDDLDLNQENDENLNVNNKNFDMNNVNKQYFLNNLLSKSF